MAILTQGTYTNGFTWDQREKTNNNLNAIIDSGQSTQILVYPTGSTSGNIYNQIWHEEGTLASGARSTYNLQSLSFDYLTETTTKTFSKVKVLSINNDAGASGEDLLVQFTGSTPFNEIFGYPTGSLRVGPGCGVGVCDKFEGWVVDTNNKTIDLVNDGTGTISYQIVIAGNTG